MTICFKRLTPTASLPAYGSAVAAGMDLHADLFAADGGLRDGVVIEDGAPAIVLHPGARTLVKTGLTAELPDGVYGRVAPRSGLALKAGIDVMAGVIDQDYRGEYGVVLVNLGTAPFVIRQGDRVAQLVLERCLRAEIVEVETLTETARGAGGFGSTGVTGLRPDRRSASMAEPRLPEHRVEITWLDDSHDCETCGSSCAEGARVSIDGSLVLDLEPVAHCYDGASWERDTILHRILAQLGAHVVVDDEPNGICGWRTEEGDGADETMDEKRARLLPASPVVVRLTTETLWEETSRDHSTGARATLEDGTVILDRPAALLGNGKSPQFDETDALIEIARHFGARLAVSVSRVGVRA